MCLEELILLDYRNRDTLVIKKIKKKRKEKNDSCSLLSRAWFELSESQLFGLSTKLGVLGRAHSSFKNLTVTTIVHDGIFDAGPHHNIDHQKIQICHVYGEDLTMADNTL